MHCSRLPPKMPASRVTKDAIAESGKQTEKKKEPNDAAEKIEGLNSMERTLQQKGGDILRCQESFV